MEAAPDVLAQAPTVSSDAATIGSAAARVKRRIRTAEPAGLVGQRRHLCAASLRLAVQPRVADGRSDRRCQRRQEADVGISEAAVLGAALDADHADGVVADGVAATLLSASPASTPRMCANEICIPGSGSLALISYSRFT